MGLGFEVLGLGFEVLGLGFEVLGPGFGVWGLGFVALGLGFEVLEPGFEVCAIGVDVLWPGFEVFGLGVEALRLGVAGLRGFRAASRGSGAESSEPNHPILGFGIFMIFCRSPTADFPNEPKVTLNGGPLLRCGVFAGPGWKGGWASEF